MTERQQVNDIAAQFNCRIYRIIHNRGVMCQMVEETATWAGQWAVGWHESEEAALSATYQHLKECEQMNVFSTKLFPYLEGLMIKDKPATLTIRSVTQEEVASQRGKENKIIVHFQERDKSLILNKTNTKQIVKFFGPETQDWHGKKITLYAEEGTWFGTHGYAVRVSEKLPKQKEKTSGNQPPNGQPPLLGGDEHPEPVTDGAFAE